MPVLLSSSDAVSGPSRTVPADQIPAFLAVAKTKSFNRAADLTKLILKDSISPLPLHRTLVLLETLEENRDDHFYDHERLALATALVNEISNLHFGPEVGVGPERAALIEK